MAPRRKTPKRVPVKWSDGFPPPGFRKLYRPLGLIVVTFADLEQMLTVTLAELLGRPYTEAMALEWLMQSLTNRIQLFYFLATETTQELARSKPEHSDSFVAMRESAKAIYEALLQANSDRNNLLHSPWTGIGTSAERSFSKERYAAEGGKLTEIPVRGITVSFLEKEAKYLASIKLRLSDWRQRMVYRDNPQDWPAPLPGRYLLPSPLKSLLRVNKGKAP